MKKIEHIGMAVKDLDASNTLDEKLLGVSHYKIEDVATEGVKTSFFKVGESKTIEEITQFLNTVLEQMIVKNPLQWIWTHDRWKK